jgi:hypothetical protein
MIIGAFLNIVRHAQNISKRREFINDAKRFRESALRIEDFFSVVLREANTEQVIRYLVRV